MWLFHSNGFLSVVAHREMPEVLLCRARVKGDLERLLPVQSVFETPDADYRFRSYLDRDAVAGVIAGHVAGIQYPAFKPSVTDKRRLPAYYSVWSIMDELQHDFASKPVMQGSSRRAPSGRLVTA